MNFPLALQQGQRQKAIKKRLWNWCKASHLECSRLKDIFPYHLHVSLAFLSIENLCFVRNQQNSGQKPAQLFWGVYKYTAVLLPMEESSQ